jgi:hypothetical protein
MRARVQRQNKTRSATRNRHCSFSIYAILDFNWLFFFVGGGGGGTRLLNEWGCCWLQLSILDVRYVEFELVSSIYAGLEVQYIRLHPWQHLLEEYFWVGPWIFIYTHQIYHFWLLEEIKLAFGQDRAAIGLRHLSVTVYHYVTIVWLGRHGPSIWCCL